MLAGQTDAGRERKSGKGKLEERKKENMCKDPSIKGTKEFCIP